MKDDLELTSAMCERRDIMDNAVYSCCCDFLDLDDGASDLEDEFPWDMSIIGEISEFIVDVLREHNYTVCDPYISRDEEDPNADEYCNCEECGFKKCPLHE